MAEYIEREAAIATACKGCNKEFPNEPCEPADCHIQQGLFKIPAADVVEVVRCKDCKHCEMCFPCKCFGLEAPPVYVCCLGHRNREVLPNDYCSCGAKMDGKGGAE